MWCASGLTRTTVHIQWCALNGTFSIHDYKHIELSCCAYLKEMREEKNCALDTFSSFSPLYSVLVVDVTGAAVAAVAAAGCW